MRRAPALALLLAIVPGCDDLQGFGGAAPALVTFDVVATGDPGADVVALRVAMIWGQQWLTEPICILPPDTAEAAAAISAGCRDPFGFVPARVAANADVILNEPTTISLFSLPAADVMVGDVTSRVAYGSFVLYDDRDASGTLELARPHRLGGREMGPPVEDQVDGADVIYGASFVSMTQADQRVAFREGGFSLAAAFYPRSGCGEPLPAFSIVAAGGFSVADAIAATARGELPAEDPASCSERTPAEAVVTIPVRPPAEVAEVGCEERRADSSIRYREPPVDAPDLTDRTAACAKVVDFGSGMAGGASQYIISGRATDRCKGLSHYVLRGCREDAACALPDWDITATPPAWWPCSP
ncbi:MAG: hypothetical protein NT062_27380 [Proteobacteria bacterium]|nr:hypothetical protein [Pseudomonadota bacterium]